MTENELQQALGHLAHDYVAVQYRRRRGHHALIIDQHLELPQRRTHLGRRQRADFRLGGTIATGNHFGALIDPYFATIQLMLQTAKSGDWWLAPSRNGVSRRPDLADIDLHELWEVKPNNADARRAGRLQLRTFHQLLSQADREYRHFARHKRYASDVGLQLIELPWTYGEWRPEPAMLTGPGGNAYRLSFENERGLILWRAAII